jgi:hypothetical protein
VEVHTTERTRHFLVKKPKKILQLRLEDKNVFNAIHLNSIGYVFEFGGEGYFAFASRALGEVIVFALAVEEECEEDFQKQAQRLELSSRQTLEKGHQKMQKEAGRAWLLMSQATHPCVGESDDLAAVSPYFWELVDAIIDDLSINQKRGTIALGNVKEERAYFEALKAEKKVKKLVNG